MDLDEQLAALAAGELDDDTARALRTRAAADPAIAQRLARHEQLQQLLEEWEAPAMSDAAVARLEARVEEALAALGDEPLADEQVAGLPPQPLAQQQDRDEPAGGAPATDGQVVDLDEARRRRGLPSWLPGAAVAAALVAVVGTGIVMGGLPGGVQEDMVAEPAQDATDEAAQEEAAEDDAAQAELFDSGDDTAAESAPAGPMRQSGIDLDEGELLALVEFAPTTTGQSNALSSGGDTAGDDDAGDDAVSDGEAATATVPERCVTEALERDTVPADEREVWLTATGTYAEQDAAFVVIRTPATPDDRYEVLAYDPVDCTLLARDETSA